MNQPKTLKHGSLIAYLILAITLLILIFQYSFVAKGYIGIIVQILAVLLMVWARFTFGLRSFHLTANPPKGGLVTSGPYHFIRHPIYTGVLLFIWTAVLTYLTLFNIFLGIIATSATLFRILAEEHLLLTMYPEYKDYASKTKRFIPYLL